MNDKQIDELATICSRYADLKSIAKITQNNLVKLRFAIFTDMINQDEINLLKDAEKIIERIASNTSTRDAIKYFHSIEY